MVGGSEGTSLSDGALSELIPEQLRRILSSVTFRRSERSRQLLDYLVKQTIGGAANALKEYTIGTDVFGRPESFDARANPIVRVEARRLRAKLVRYYAREAQGEPILIQLLPGSYVPVFRAQEKREGSGSGMPRPRITLLRITPLGRSAELAYFSRGLTAELSHGLSSVEGIHILTSDTGPVARDGPRGDERAKRLGAEWLLECTVRQEKRRFRVSAELRQVGDASLHWSDMRDSGTGSQITSQQEIAAAIVRGVSTALG